MIKQTILLITTATLLAACGSSGNSNGRRACTNAPAGQYCIQSGDTLTRISQRFRVSVADLRRWNQLPDDTIHVGDKLIIRAPNSSSANNKITVGNSSSAFRIQMPVKGTLIQGYSAANKGIDIAAERGALVHAAADGTVIYAGSSIPQYGKMLLIRHSNTTITAYANNANLLVPLNARVKAGQIIAEVGDSGRNDGRTALHFELRVNGKHVNPMNYLR